MKRFSRSITVLLMATTALAAEAGGSGAAVDGTAEPLAGRVVRVSSGRCVGLERQAACYEAQQKAQQQLAGELAKLADELAGRSLLPRRMVEEQAWLFSQPGVDRKDELTVDERHYGPVAEHSIRISLPDAVLAQWVARLAAQHQRQTMLLLWAAAGTVIGWLAGLVLLVRLDRATGGYYRRVLVPGAIVLLAAANVLGWAWLLVLA